MVRRVALFVLVSLLFLPLPTLANPNGLVHPPEYAPLEEVLWGCNDTYLVYDIYKGSISGTHHEDVTHIVLVDSRESAYELLYDLYYDGVPLDRAKFYICAIDSVWMRDYGPLVVKEADGSRTIVDLDYYYGRPNDDVVPRLYANFRGFGYRAADLDYEGGNFMTDGHGNAFASASVFQHNSHLSQSRVESIFSSQMGCDRLYTFEWLVNDGTTHIDMYSKLLGDGQVLVSSVPRGDQNYALLERNAAKYAALGYRVIRVPMASSRGLQTYTNSTLVNGTALVPTYGSRYDAQALDAYRSAGYQAVGIDCSLAIQYGGAIHCVSMQVPK